MLLPSLLGLTAVFLVGAVSWFLPLPAPLAAAALVVGSLSLVLFFVAVWRESRASGVGLFRATGSAIRQTLGMFLSLP